MPTRFIKCVRKHGRVRTLRLGNCKYRHICFPSGKGGAGVLGHVHTKTNCKQKIPVRPR